MVLKRGKSAVRALAAAKAGVLCRGLAAIGEGVFTYMERLEAAGFCGFQPRLRFMESFCARQEDCEVHRRCIIERAKNLLGRPWPLRARRSEREAFFHSDYIQNLKARRDAENGVDEMQLADRYPGEIWRLEYDPCLQAHARFVISQPSQNAQRMEQVLYEERSIIERETSRHATGLSDQYASEGSEVGGSGRIEFLIAVMQREIGGLGYEYDSLKGGSDYPVFSKPVGKEWDLCWVLDDVSAFALGVAIGRYVPLLQLRHRRLAGDLRGAKSGEWLQFRYRGIVPGFDQAYSQFYDLDELEMLIKANVCFYAMMAPTVEGICREILE